MPTHAHDRHLETSFAEFFEDFLAGDVGEAEAGDWFDWTLEWWAAAQRFPQQILVVHYEQMLRDPAGEAARVAAFLGAELSPSELRGVVERSSFRAMKADHETLMSAHEASTGQVTRRPGASPHFRRGASGGWRESFSSSDAARLRRLYESRMAGSGLGHDFG